MNAIGRLEHSIAHFIILLCIMHFKGLLTSGRYFSYIALNSTYKDKLKKHKDADEKYTYNL